MLIATTPSNTRRKASLSRKRSRRARQNTEYRVSCLRYRACRTSDRQGSLESQRKSAARSGSQTHSRQVASGSSEPDQSKAGQCASNKALAPCAPNSDRAARRSSAPNDRVELPCRDQKNRKTVLVRPPAAPSCAAPADALSTTESRILSRLNVCFATESGANRK